MGNNYLNSILGVLPAVQARQISEILQDLQVAGSIRNLEEYSTKLAELSSLINSNTPTPLFSPIYALVWNLCSSDAHNIMMKSAKQDIEAAFLQVNEIGEKLNDNNILYMKNILADLEKGLNKQEANIKRLELLADKNNEFTEALVNTFASSSLYQVSKSDPDTKSLFFDNRTYQLLSGSEIPMAFVSEAESLILNNFSNISSKINPLSIKLQTNEYSYTSEHSVDDGDLTNLIDGKIGTYWTHSVYLMDVVPEVDVVLEFNLGIAKDINYIVIEPATSEPFFIKDITSIAINGERINLYSIETEIEGKSRIDFDRTNTVSVLVTLSTKTSRRAEYFHKSITKFSSDNNWIDKFNAISSASRQSLNNNKVADICNIPQQSYSQINHNLYTIALDNIWFGNSLYNNEGIFVMGPLSVTNVGNIAVNAISKAETSTIKNSIEFDIIKRDKTPKQKETKIPIPYLNQLYIDSERLIFTKKTSDTSINNICNLRFLPRLNYSVVIYKNGELLSLGSDWLFSVAQIVNNSTDISFDWKTSLSAIDYMDYTISPLGFYIKIENLDPSAIYTINYYIFNSNTSTSSGDYKTVWVDSNNTISLLDNGLLNFTKDSNYNIESDIYLQITLRRNLSSKATTPELYECAILANRYE